MYGSTPEKMQGASREAIGPWVQNVASAQEWGRRQEAGLGRNSNAVEIFSPLSLFPKASIVALRDSVGDLTARSKSSGDQ